MPTQREIDLARAKRDKEFARLREEAERATRESTVIKPRKPAEPPKPAKPPKRPKARKRYEDSTFCVAALLLALSLFGCTTAANAVEIELQPQPCYNVQAYTVPASDQATQYALIFNQCDSTFRWIKVPKPPEHEI
jgi:hypothetical protein